MSARRFLSFGFISISIAVGCSTSNTGFFTDGGTEGGGSNNNNPFGVDGGKKDGGKDSGTVEEEDAGTTKKDSSAGSCTLQVDLGAGASCNSCAETNCCEKLNACVASADCVALNDCLIACDGKPDAGGCEDACATAHPTGAQIFVDGADCVQSSCSSECQ